MNIMFASMVLAPVFLVLLCCRWFCYCHHHRTDDELRFVSLCRPFCFPLAPVYYCSCSCGGGCAVRDSTLFQNQFNFTQFKYLRNKASQVDLYNLAKWLASENKKSTKNPNCVIEIGNTLIRSNGKFSILIWKQAKISVFIFWTSEACLCIICSFLCCVFSFHGNFHNIHTQNKGCKMLRFPLLYHSMF